MTEPRIDNRMLDCLYGESDEETRRRALEEMGPEERAQLEELQDLRSAFADLSDDDELGSVARANILREARLAAAERREKREATPGFPWFPALALGALALVIGVGTWLFLYRPPATEPVEDKSSDEIVATGTQAEGDEIAKQLPPAEQELELPDGEEPEEPGPAARSRQQASPSAPATDASPEEAQPLEATSKSAANEQKPNPIANSGADRQSSRMAKEVPKKAPKLEQEKSADLAPSVASNRATGASSGASSGSGNYNLDSIGQKRERDVDPNGFAQGVASYNDGNYQDAVEQLTNALTAGTGDRKEALLYRGLASQKLGKHIDAISDFREVLDNHGSWSRASEAELALADSMVAVGNPSGAKEHYRAVADGDSSQADTARERMNTLQSAPGGGVDSGDESAPARDDKKRRSKRKKSTEKSKDAKKSMEMDDAFESNESKGSIVY